MHSSCNTSPISRLLIFAKTHSIACSNTHKRLFANVGAIYLIFYANDHPFLLPLYETSCFQVYLEFSVSSYRKILPRRKCAKVGSIKLKHN